MKKVRKEVCQTPMVIPENIIRMSSENNLEVTVITKAGQEYKGVIEKPYWPNGIFLRQKGDNTDFHACISGDSIDSISFETPSGLLDELIDTLN